jgi:hypothetical protein
MAGRAPHVDISGRRDDWVIDDGETTRSRQPLGRRPRLVTADDRDRHDGHTERARQPEGAESEALDASVRAPARFRKDHDRFPRVEEAHRCTRGACVGGLDVNREGAEATDEPGEAADAKERVPGHVIDTPSHRDRREYRIGVGHVVRHNEERTRAGDVMDTLEADPEVQPRSEPHHRAERVDHGCAHAPIVPRGA